MISYGASFLVVVRFSNLVGSDGKTAFPVKEKTWSQLLQD